MLAHFLTLLTFLGMQFPFPGPGRSSAGGGGITQVGTPTKCETGSTVTSLNCAYTATSGNSLRVGVFGFLSTGTPTGCTDGTNTYTLIGTRAASTNGAKGGLLRADSITGGSLTINCTTSGNSAGIIIFVVEYSGLGATMDGTDVSCGSSGTGWCAGNGSSTAADSGGMTTSNAVDQITGLIVSDSGGNPCTMTAGTGWTMILSETNGTTFGCAGLQTRITSSTGTYNGTATVANTGWMSIIAASH